MQYIVRAAYKEKRKQYRSIHTLMQFFSVLPSVCKHTYRQTHTRAKVHTCRVMVPLSHRFNGLLLLSFLVWPSFLLCSSLSLASCRPALTRVCLLRKHIHAHTRSHAYTLRTALLFKHTYKTVEYGLNLNFRNAQRAKRDGRDCFCFLLFLLLLLLLLC